MYRKNDKLNKWQRSHINPIRKSETQFIAGMARLQGAGVNLLGWELAQRFLNILDSNPYSLTFVATMIRRDLDTFNAYDRKKDKNFELLGGLHTREIQDARGASYTISLGLSFPIISKSYSQENLFAELPFLLFLKIIHLMPVSIAYEFSLVARGENGKLEPPEKIEYGLDFIVLYDINRRIRAILREPSDEQQDTIKGSRARKRIYGAINEGIGIPQMGFGLIQRAYIAHQQKKGQN